MRLRWLTSMLLVMFVISASAAQAFEDSNPFQGHWGGTDGTDGSWNTLTVGGGNNHTVYRETGLTACLGFGEGLVPGSAQGFATIDGNSLTFTATLYCQLESGRVAHPNFTDFEWVVVHEPSTASVSLVADPDTTLFRPGG